MKIMCPLNTLKMFSHTLYLLALPGKEKKNLWQILANWQKIIIRKPKKKEKKFDDFEK